MRLLVVLLVLSGCKKGVIGGECEADSPALGSAGAFDHEVFDFTFDKGLTEGIAITPAFAFQVPDDLSSLSLTVEAQGLSTGFAYVAMGDTVWIDASRRSGDPGGWDSPPFYHWAIEGGSLAFPITPDSEPEVGCLIVQPAALDRQEGVAGALHVVSRRYAPSSPVVDLNVGVLAGVDLSQEDLDDALARVHQVWSEGGGPALGEVRLYEVEWGSPFLAYGDSNALRSVPLDGPEQSMNLFVIQDYSDEAGTLGEAGGIPGPLGLNGVDASAVIVAVDGHTYVEGGVDTRTMGETIAHEVGHQMGLYHTTESDGTTTESLADTLVCPESADADGDGWYYAEECADYDGTNFMFWATGEDMDQDVVSASQAQVLARSVVSR